MTIEKKPTKTSDKGAVTDDTSLPEDKGGVAPGAGYDDGVTPVTDVNEKQRLLEQERKNKG